MVKSVETHMSERDNIISLPVRRRVNDIALNRKAECVDIDASIQKLQVQSAICVRVLRILWIMNVAVTVAGAAARKPEVAIVGAASAILALLGTGIARVRARTLAQTLEQYRKSKGCDSGNNSR